MGTTEKGIVYPDSTSHTRIWEHFQAQAESVDAALDEITAGGGSVAEPPQAGVITIDPVANTVTSKRFNFATPFSSPPVVMVTAVSTVPGVVVEVSAANATTTGVDVYVKRANGTSTPIAVLAIPKTQADQ